MRSKLRAIVRDLAERFDAVPFEPHVTVFCGPASKTEALAAAWRIARQESPITLTADRLDHTETYTKTLFVQFQELAALRRMFEAAKSYSPHAPYVLNPHLSLLYKRLPEAARRELCETLAAPMGDYSFDRIRLVETELPIEDDGPIRRWLVTCDEPLLRS